MSVDPESILAIGTTNEFNCMIAGGFNRLDFALAHPKAGFADPDKLFPTSKGADDWKFGPRNSPTVAYSSFLPPLQFNPDGPTFLDNGLADTVAQFYPEGAFWELGRFKTPTLRNIEKTAPYGHNGAFATLKDVVRFYNTRDVPSANWAPPQFQHNMVQGVVGDLGLTGDEEDAIVAFLKTLTDR